MATTGQNYWSMKTELSNLIPNKQEIPYLRIPFSKAYPDSRIKTPFGKKAGHYPLKKALQKVFGKAMRRPNKILCRSKLSVMGIQNFGEGSSARPKPLIDRDFQGYAKPS